MAKEQEARCKNWKVGVRSGGVVKPGRAQKKGCTVAGNCVGNWDSELMVSGSWPPWQESPVQPLYSDLT